MPVYFAQAGDDGPVKIGTAVNVERRMLVLQSGCPYPLKVLRVIEGSHPEESWLHRRYKHLRTVGEWFTFDAEMLTVEPTPSATSAPFPKIVEAESRAAEHGLNVNELCDRAGIHRGTWQRWKSGVSSPNLRNWFRVEAVLREAESAA